MSSQQKKHKKCLKRKMSVTLEQAEEILYFLRKLTNIQVPHYLKKDKKKKTNDQH